MTTRTITITLDVDDAAYDGETYSDTDIAESFLARLEEVPGMDCAPTSDVRVSVMNRDAVDKFLDAAEVGLEGTDDDDLDAVHAWQILGDLRA